MFLIKSVGYFTKFLRKSSNIVEFRLYSNLLCKQDCILSTRSGASTYEYALLGVYSSEYTNLGVYPSEYTNLGVYSSEYTNLGVYSSEYTVLACVLSMR